MLRVICRTFVVFTLLGLPAAQAAQYKVDTGHSTVDFKIRHLFSNVRGTFNDFEGTVNYDPSDPSSWSVEGSVAVASIDTNEPDRDKHLKNADFFDVEKFPKMTFKSTGVESVDGSKAKLNGLLTIHGVEKPVVFELEAHGVGKDPWGNTRAGFSATTQINRSDYGLGWNKALETGGLLVGEDVQILLEIEAIEQQ